MADTIQLNLNVHPETRRRIIQIAELTHRKPGQTLDWLVEEAWKKLGSEIQFEEIDGGERSLPIGKE